MSQHDGKNMPETKVIEIKNRTIGITDAVLGAVKLISTELIWQSKENSTIHITGDYENEKIIVGRHLLRLLPHDYKDKN